MAFFKNPPREMGRPFAWFVDGCKNIIMKPMKGVADLGVWAVHRQVEQYGGIVKSGFSQHSGEWGRNLDCYKDIKGGVCCGLSLKWLEAESNGIDFLELIYNGQELNYEVFDSVCSVQRFVQRYGHSDVEDEWLENRGMAIFHRKSSKDVSREGFVTNLVEAIINESRRGFPYKFISVDFGGSAHFMAVSYDFGRGVIKYFDPNFGEFHFNSEKAFMNWFVHGFCSLPFCANMSVLGKSFVVRHIGKEHVGKERFDDFVENVRRESGLAIKCVDSESFVVPSDDDLRFELSRFENNRVAVYCDVGDVLNGNKLPSSYVRPKPNFDFGCSGNRVVLWKDASLLNCQPADFAQDISGFMEGAKYMKSDLISRGAIKD